jgi:DDE superfamily endonuclease
VARGDVACDQKGAEAEQQTLLFLDESGCYPLPTVARTYAPMGQTPIVREWCTRDHLSAISTLSPEGKLSCHSQDHPINSHDVVRFLEPLPREEAGLAATRCATFSMPFSISCGAAVRGACGPMLCPRGTRWITTVGCGVCRAVGRGSIRRGADSVS